MINLDIGIESGVYTGEYIGKEMFGLKQEHNYTFELKHNGRTYEMSIISDNTIDEEVDVFIPYSSEKSIRRNWTINEDKEE